MTDDLPPKLREFEAKLRQLKPFCLTTENTENARRARRNVPNLRVFREPSVPSVVKIALATAATILALVWLFPQPQPTEQVSVPLLPSAVCRLPSPVAADPLPSSNMRQQLAELLDEMNVAELQTVAKREYPVVEIVVQTNPPQVVTPMGERIRWRWDEFDFF